MPIALIQAILLILWYAVPAMAAVPAWVVFLPLILAAAGLGLWLFFMLVIFVIAALID